MELSKLEKAIALGTILNSMDEDNLEEYVELETLRPVVKVLNRLNKRTKPEQKKEAITNLISKLMDDLLNSKE
ncbi:hypothetical protein BK727_07145 [Bacillus thuringiensis serovar roskildiensis]|uniref:Phage protein n=1 Tax=Bacillus thuringiensis serovar sooncheon TaxID=180891 RepID=A0A9Q5X5H0_BACTU|nr:hypothetical protein [Bacillus thuringiensis]OTW72651.1 hypothetical protein BK707_06100 [Bacillus thuringiensis serovar coreanensis]OTX49707.1 hypothetical protein BK724_09770 [Bacillus thuringiensis serovar sooncheon]OTX57117.1 hypothetical protein BK725_04710 [Bacillus thuringiensis serovar guiyangiensis]OTX72040.1 hypothetical protein BK727_07145 [Bacillus thuringiensis serovar roskildiensis]